MKTVKQVTKLCDNCNKCRLPQITCICNKIKCIETKAKFIILTNEKEVYRNTNTANLLKISTPESTEIIIWERGKVNSKIIEYKKNNKYKLFLVFPTINENLKSREVKYKIEGEYIPIFIIIDGTWKEAWKIIRKSEYLNDLPVISLEVKNQSRFTLRRGQDEGNLCTIETAMELLTLNGEESSRNIIDEYFKLFLKHYKAGASGHTTV